jgi:hypothetical protein
MGEALESAGNERKRGVQAGEATYRERERERPRGAGERGMTVSNLDGYTEYLRSLTRVSGERVLIENNFDETHCESFTGLACL